MFVIITALNLNLAACIPAFLAFVDSFYTVEHYYPIKIIGIVSSVFVPVIFILGVTGVAVGASLGLVIHIIMMFHRNKILMQNQIKQVKNIMIL